MLRHTKPEENNNKPANIQSFNTDFVSGLLSGVASVALFNPWDRALNLSMVHSRPFLKCVNFTSPYQGVMQAIVQRAFLGGVYFIMQSQLNTHFRPWLQQRGGNELATQFCVGILTGSFCAAITNSTSAIKYYTWNQKGRTFFQSAREMWQLGGIKPFIKGKRATILRDATFGCTYEVLRHFVHDQVDSYCHEKINHLNLYCNIFSAMVAAVASSPFNYVRTMHYACPPDATPPTVLNILKEIWNESKAQPKGFLGRIGFFQNTFKLGWGTSRVALGMAAGQAGFDYTKEFLSRPKF